MATVSYTENREDYDNQRFTWTPLTTTNTTGQAACYTGSGDRTVQVFGTFGTGGSVAIEGSLDGVNWVALKTAASVTIAITAAGMAVVLENVVFIRPKVTAGDGTTSLTVILGIRRK